MRRWSLPEQGTELTTSRVDWHEWAKHLLEKTTANTEAIEAAKAELRAEMQQLHYEATHIRVTPELAEALRRAMGR